MRLSQWPVRLRLTVLYAAAFLAAGVVMIAVTYTLTSWSLAEPIEHRVDTRALHVAATGGGTVADTLRQGIEAYRSEALKSVLMWSLVALAGALVVAAGSGWVLAGRALRPLRQISETAERVAHQSLHKRIGLQGPKDEVKELADTIDEMLERLDHSFDAQRRFVANASHELRTPLAVNRTLLEVAASAPGASDDLRRLAPTLLATNERSERLIEGLLTLARAEHEVTERSALDLADLAATAIEYERSEALERTITLRTDLHPASVEGNAVLLERLAVNLIQNAVRHSPAGAEAVVRTGGVNGGSFLEVENPGRLLRQYEVDRLFEPFHRGDGRSSGGGVGLGLSIVRSVTQAHRGTVQAHPPEGGGLVVRVTLPVPQRARNSGPGRRPVSAPDP